MQARPPSHLENRSEDPDILADDTFDAFAVGSTPATTPQRSERARTRRGGPFAPLPLLPLIGLAAGVGIAYVSQTAHITQASYQETTLAGKQSELERQATQLQDDLARLQSPERIDAAAQRLGLKPPAHWAYVIQVPAPIGAPATTRLPGGSTTPAAGDHVVQAMVGSVGDGPSASRPVTGSGAGTP